MKNKFDERMQLEIYEMRAKLFNFTFLFFFVGWALKKAIFKSDADMYMMYDTITLFAVLTYAIFLQYKYRFDSYDIDKLKFSTYMLSMSIIGLVVSFIITRSNNVDLTAGYGVMTLFITFGSFIAFSIFFYILVIGIRFLWHKYVSKEEIE